MSSVGWRHCAGNCCVAIARFRALTAGSNSVVKLLGGWGALDGVIRVGWWHFSKDVAASHSQTAVAAAGTLRRHIRILLLRQQGRCGVTFADCCWGSSYVAASHSQTAVAAAETLRRHTRRLLLRQQRRCGVTLEDCCCGSKDVAASHSQTAVAAAETLRRPFSHCCCGSRDVAASHSQTAVAAAETLRRHTRRLLLRQQRRCSFQNSPLSSGGASVVQASTVKAVSQGSASVSVCGVGFRRFDDGAKSSKSVATCDRVANWRG